MATATHQPEITYRGPAHAGAPRLSDVDGIETVAVEQDRAVQEQERYDTADLRLAAAGIVLAVHRLPDSAHWQLTLPDVGSAEQPRVPVAAPDVEGVDPEQVPDEIDALVRGVRGDRPIVPVGRIRVVRSSSRLRDLSGRDIAVLCRDEVQASTLGASTSIESWSEARLAPEVGAGSALLDQLDARLRETGLTSAPPAAESTLERMLAETREASGPGDEADGTEDKDAPSSLRWSGRKGTAGTVLLDYLGAQADRLTARERGLRDGEPDAVHQMRVASRRLRSALRTYGGLLEGPRVEHVITELQWLGRALATDRDLEVLEARIGSALDELPPELVLGPVHVQLTRYFAGRRADSRAAVQETVDGERYRKLQGALRRLLIDPPLAGAADASAKKVMPAMVARTAKKLDRRMELALHGPRDAEGQDGGQDGGQADADHDAALHGARRTAKQLRYATEVVQPVVGGDAKASRRGLGELQDVLGAHQDAVVAREPLRELGARAGAQGQNGFTFGLLYGREMAQAREAEAAVPGVWSRIWAKKGRRWMS